MAELFDLEIITPEKIVFKGRISSVTCPGADGRFQILRNHAPFISALEIGQLWFIDEEGKRRLFAVSGGASHVLKNKVLILADTAESREDIDASRAASAKNRATDRLRIKDPDIDVDRARLALYRALNRLKTANKQ
jgi:F-type H+-transporting ATPase subunit epsilon